RGREGVERLAVARGEMRTRRARLPGAWLLTDARVIFRDRPCVLRSDRGHPQEPGQSMARYCIHATWLFAAIAAGVVMGAAVVSADEAPQRQPREYYLDSRTGSDQGDGSQSHPWQSLGPLNHVAFAPGDTVLFACGSEFTGGFEVRQSGTAAAPITI